MQLYKSYWQVYKIWMQLYKNIVQMYKVLFCTKIDSNCTEVGVFVQKPISIVQNTLSDVQKHLSNVHTKILLLPLNPKRRILSNFHFFDFQKCPYLPTPQHYNDSIPSHRDVNEVQNWYVSHSTFSAHSQKHQNHQKD